MLCELFDVFFCMMVVFFNSIHKAIHLGIGLTVVTWALWRTFLEQYGALLWVELEYLVLFIHWVQCQRVE